MKHTFVVAVYVAHTKACLLCIVALVYVFLGLPAALFPLFLFGLCTFSSPPSLKCLHTSGKG